MVAITNPSGREEISIVNDGMAMRTYQGVCRSCIVQDYASGSVESNLERRAEEFQAMLARLGPAFVKAGNLGLVSRIACWHQHAVVHL